MEYNKYDSSCDDLTGTYAKWLLILYLNSACMWIQAQHTTFETLDSTTFNEWPSTGIMWPLIGRFMGADVGPIWGRQDPGGPHVGRTNFALWDVCFQVLGWTVYMCSCWASFRCHIITNEKCWFDGKNYCQLMTVLSGNKIRSWELDHVQSKYWDSITYFDNLLASMIQPQ